MVVHGEDHVTDSFAELASKEIGCPAFAPYSGGCVDLADEYSDYGRVHRYRRRLLRSRQEHVPMLHLNVLVAAAKTTAAGGSIRMKDWRTKIWPNSRHRFRIWQTNGIVNVKD